MHLNSGCVKLGHCERTIQVAKQVTSVAGVIAGKVMLSGPPLGRKLQSGENARTANLDGEDREQNKKRVPHGANARPLLHSGTGSLFLILDNAAVDTRLQQKPSWRFMVAEPARACRGDRQSHYHLRWIARGVLKHKGLYSSANGQGAEDGEARMIRARIPHVPPDSQHSAPVHDQLHHAACI